MSNLETKFSLSVAVNILKDEEEYYELSQNYYNLDYSELAEIEEILANSIAKISKIDKQKVIKLGEDPNLFTG